MHRNRFTFQCSWLDSGILPLTGESTADVRLRLVALLSLGVGACGISDIKREDLVRGLRVVGNDGRIDDGLKPLYQVCRRVQCP